MCNDKFLLEEFKERYNQYRWLDESRAKFIHYYIILYVGFYTVLGYALGNSATLNNFPYKDNLNFQLGFLFLLALIVSSLIILGIENFRFMQIKGGIYLKQLVKISGSDQLKTIWDKHPDDFKLFLYLYSTTYAVIGLHIMNFVLLVLTIYFFKEKELDSNSVCLYLIIYGVVVLLIQVLKILNLKSYEGKFNNSSENETPS